MTRRLELDEMQLDHVAEGWQFSRANFSRM